MAELNRQIFHENDEIQGETDIENWIIQNDELVKLEDAMIEDDEIVEVLSPHELLKHILMSVKGEKTVV